MSFTISIPIMVAIVCFVVPVTYGAFLSIRDSDGFPFFVTIFVGVFIAILGWGMSQAIIERIHINKTFKALEVTQEGYLDAMPEDWQQLRKLIDETDTIPLKKAYVLDFLKDKIEPEISGKEFELFYSRSKCRSSSATCKDWRVWLAKEMLPHVSIDVYAAFGELSQAKE